MSQGWSWYVVCVFPMCGHEETIEEVEMKQMRKYGVAAYMSLDERVNML